MVGEEEGENRTQFVKEFAMGVAGISVAVVREDEERASAAPLAELKSLVADLVEKLGLHEVEGHHTAL